MGPDTEHKHFFSHPHSNLCHTFRCATQAVARDRGGAISDSERGWTCDPLDRKLQRRLPDISPLHSCNEGFVASPLLSDPSRDVSEFRFLCCCPRVLVFGNAQTAAGMCSCLKSSSCAIVRNFGRRHHKLWFPNQRGCIGSRVALHQIFSVTFKQLRRVTPTEFRKLYEKELSSGCNETNTKSEVTVTERQD